ncbi:translation initiation factor IF-2-like [Schistocerca cancellata]|uniref:translation initiation factor IF-2-like n=1 Tax=Schistocerca cancellata TaxID=274614 RepID=UPI002119686B|nr:translation initiation factor IF-2-like [Schistocerca cancellata]
MKMILERPHERYGSAIFARPGIRVTSASLTDRRPNSEGATQTAGRGADTAPREGAQHSNVAALRGRGTKAAATASPPQLSPAQFLPTGGSNETITGYMPHPAAAAAAAAAAESRPVRAAQRVGRSRSAPPASSLQPPASRKGISGPPPPQAARQRFMSRRHRPPAPASALHCGPLSGAKRPAAETEAGATRGGRRVYPAPARGAAPDKDPWPAGHVRRGARPSGRYSASGRRGSGQIQVGAAGRNSVTVGVTDDRQCDTLRQPSASGTAAAGVQSLRVRRGSAPPLRHMLLLPEAPARFAPSDNCSAPVKFLVALLGGRVSTRWFPRPLRHGLRRRMAALRARRRRLRRDCCACADDPSNLLRRLPPPRHAAHPLDSQRIPPRRNRLITRCALADSSSRPVRPVPSWTPASHLSWSPSSAFTYFR